MSRSVLIVDDDARDRASLPAAIAPEADAVRVAEDGPAALSAIAAEPPDVVLTDVRMPGMDGLELLRLLRERAPDRAALRESQSPTSASGTSATSITMSRIRARKESVRRMADR